MRGIHNASLPVVYRSALAN